MKRQFSSFLLLIFFLMVSLSVPIETEAQVFIKTVNADGDVITLTYTGVVDSATTITSPIFSFGDFYDFSTYPVEYEFSYTKFGTGHASFTTYADGGLTNSSSGMVNGIDTVAATDTTSALHGGTANFNRRKPHYRIRTQSVVTTTLDSATLAWRFYYKLE